MTAVKNPNQTPGVQAFLGQLPREVASKIPDNEAVWKALGSFIGPGNSHGREMDQRRRARKQIATLTDFPRLLKEYAALTGSGPEVTQAASLHIIDTIMSGHEGWQMAGMGGFQATNNLGGAMGGFDLAELDLTSYSAPAAANQAYCNYMLANMNAPVMSPEFAYEMSMSGLLPIARQVIPNTVWMKIFPIDVFGPNEYSRPYPLKDRHTHAYQFGLNSNMADLRPSEHNVYDTVMVTPQEWKKSDQVDQKWVEAMQFDVIGDMLADSGRELQLKFDQIGFQALDFVVKSAQAAPGAGSTTNGFTLATDANGTVMLLETNRNPQVEHLNYANMFLRTKGFTPDLIIIPPFQLATLMSQQAVLHEYAFGNRSVQETGMVGMLTGNAVAWCPNLYLSGAPSSYVMYVVDSSELARTVLGSPLTVYPEKGFRSIRNTLYTRIAHFLRNAHACVKIVCGNIDPGVV